MSNPKRPAPHRGDGGRITPLDVREVVAGVHSVLESLRSDTCRLQKIYVARDKEGRSVGLIRSLARDAGIPVRQKSPDDLNRLVPGLNHQGVVGLVRLFEPAAVEDMLSSAHSRSEAPLLLVLDQLQDPQNLGSLIRTAHCAGAHGVLAPLHRAAPFTAAVGRASAGALEHTMLAQVSNVVRHLEELKKAGLWIYGADPGAVATLYETDLTVPLALVLGSEGKGIRPLVKRTCDALFRIPMLGRVGSLNAAVSGAVALFEAIRQRSAARSRAL